MKKLCFFLLLLLLACQKDPAPDPNQPCFLEGWGQIRVQNFNDDRYELVINTMPELKVLVDGNATVDIQKVAAGLYRVRWINLRTNGVGEKEDFSVELCDIVLLPIIF